MHHNNSLALFCPILKLPPPPCAALLIYNIYVYIYIYIYIHTYTYVYVYVLFFILIVYIYICIHVFNKVLAILFLKTKTNHFLILKFSNDYHLPIQLMFVSLLGSVCLMVPPSKQIRCICFFQFCTLMCWFGGHVPNSSLHSKPCQINGKSIWQSSRSSKGMPHEGCILFIYHAPQ